MHPHLTPDDIARFWSYVDRDPSLHGCWLWTRSKRGLGYGRLRIHGVQYAAHRLSWFMQYGPIPDGLWVLHNCPGGDNPSCVQPLHLWLGDHLANERDKTAKGRRPPLPLKRAHGEGVNTARLTAAQVHTIQSRYAAGNVLQRELAAEYGITQTNVSAIVRGETWQHLNSLEA